uniref:Uncharacterized protein n=1 Tax=Arundo donax TaxID=35708 RepID=A0A0A9HDB1_ARUDO
MGHADPELFYLKFLQTLLASRVNLLWVYLMMVLLDLWTLTNICLW